MPLDQETILKAVREAKEKAGKRNFTQSIDLIINLRDVDPKKPENRIQELIELPHETPKKNRICVIASGELALRAKASGADRVLERKELEVLAGDKKKQRRIANEYEFFLAEAPLMPLVGKILGPILGPRGKMPTPVPPAANVDQYVQRRRKMVMVRMRGQPVLQCRVGTENMPDNEIAENVLAVVNAIEGKLKRGRKNISSIYLKASMGQPVKIKV